MICGDIINKDMIKADTIKTPELYIIENDSINKDII